jgi:putative endonuclease
MNKAYYVYIMTNRSNYALYVGVTNNLERRVYEHKNGLNEGFTKKYKVHKLVVFEVFEDPETAINREKQLKAGSRKKKLDLINQNNPQWLDLSDQIATLRSQ